MEELLARKTRIPVHLAENQVEAHPDAFQVVSAPARIYVKRRDLWMPLDSTVSTRPRVEAEMLPGTFEFMTEKSSDMIFLASPDGELLYVNPASCTALGYQREELLAECVYVVESTLQYESMLGQIEGYDAQARTFATQWRRAYGSLMPVEVSVSGLRIHGERFVGAHVRDITERRRGQEALATAKCEAQAASQAKSSFMSNMSHELRTPMTAVLGFADMLAEELKHPPHREMVMTIKRNGEYLLALLNDILDLSKVEADKMEIQQHPLDVRRLVEEVQSLMSIRAHEEGIPLEFEWEAEVPAEVTGDEIRVRQILVNLIGNALKFTDEGAVRIVIGMDRELKPPRLIFTIHDTGIGIHDSHLPELFTPFSQSGVQRRKRFGGTGLGLSISKRLAEEMGGTISVHSELGVGSCFTFSLPLAQSQAAQHQALVKREPLPVNAHSRNRIPEIDARVLLADDRRDIWRVGKYFLEKCGASVTVVEDGLQAVEETQRAVREGRPFDLILMDMQMPVMTGPEAVAEIRQMGVTAPIIALTADAMEGEREACIEMGCDDYLPKPIDGTKLINLVAFHLEK